MFSIHFSLNMSRASLCPSSGEQRPCYCIWCIALILLDVVGSGCGALRSAPQPLSTTSMYVCVYVLCLCVFMYVYMYVLCMYICMYVCVCMYVCIYVCMCVCMYVYMYYVCMYVCMYYVCMYVYVCIYIHTYISVAKRLYSDLAHLDIEVPR